MARAKKKATKKQAAKPKAKAKKPKAKAAAKKAKPAAKKPAANKSAAKKPAAKKPAAEKPTTNGEPAKSSKAAVLEQFRFFYPDEWTDEKILETDPNDFDVDPVPFYEQLGQLFGVADDPDSNYFGGYGGTIAQTIAFIDKSWDGKLRKAEPAEDSDDMQVE